MTALISKLKYSTLFIYICMADLWFRWFEYYHAYRSGNTFNECLLWCWSKICGSLDEILSLTMGSYESKILNKF